VLGFARVPFAVFRDCVPTETDFSREHPVFRSKKPSYPLCPDVIFTHFPLLVVG